jgi:hypothetical protein
MAKKDRLKCPIPMEKWPNLGYDKSFEIDRSVLQNAKKTFGYLEVEEIVASVKDGMFTIRIGNGINDIGIIKSEVDYEDASAVYSSTLMDFIRVIRGPVKIAFKNDSPMMIIGQDENSRIQWLVSPVLPEEIGGR